MKGRDLIERLEKLTPAEVWRPLAGWPYEVSNLGKVRSIRTGTVLRPSTSHNGYLHVRFFVGKRQASFRVHRLVAQAWLGDVRRPLEVNHKDGVKSNNAVDNLEIVTKAQNEAHAVLVGLKATGARHGVHTRPHRVARGARAGLAKLTDEAVLSIRAARAAGQKLQEIADAHQVHFSLVSKICKRRIWTHI